MSSLAGVDVADPRHRELGAGADLERDALGAAVARSALHQTSRSSPRVLRYSQLTCGVATIVRVPARRRGARQLQRLLERRGTVVDSGQYMAVQIDHGRRVTLCPRG